MYSSSITLIFVVQRGMLNWTAIWSRGTLGNTMYLKHTNISIYVAHDNNSLHLLVSGKPLCDTYSEHRK